MDISPDLLIPTRSEHQMRVERFAKEITGGVILNYAHMSDDFRALVDLRAADCEKIRMSFYDRADMLAHRLDLLYADRPDWWNLRSIALEAEELARDIRAFDEAIQTTGRQVAG